MIDAEFIRSLAGLSKSELPDSVIDSLKLLDLVSDSASKLQTDNPTVTYTATQLNYYMGYKAIVVLGPSLKVSIPQNIQDNFNKFSRFNSLEALEELIAKAKIHVEALEYPNMKGRSLVGVISPTRDLVTSEVR